MCIMCARCLHLLSCASRCTWVNAACSEKQHVPIDQYLDNMRSIVQHVRRAGANATVIITPPPVYEPDRLIDRQKKHGINERTELAERTNEMTGANVATGTLQSGAHTGQ